jgi:hypothetical protein
MGWYELASLIVTALGLLGCLWFIVDYHYRTGGSWTKLGSWSESDAGRFMMADRVALASLLLLVVSIRVFGQWPGRQIVTFVIYVFYMAFAWWPLRLLHRAPGVKSEEANDRL